MTDVLGELKTQKGRHCRDKLQKLLSAWTRGRKQGGVCRSHSGGCLAGVGSREETAPPESLPRAVSHLCIRPPWDLLAGSLSM